MKDVIVMETDRQGNRHEKQPETPDETKSVQNKEKSADHPEPETYSNNPFAPLTRITEIEY
jgi:hypothetical protein